ncbi:histidine utilization repressor [Virgisporangium aurantiacum]
MAPFEARTPKYIHVLNTLRQRIGDGTYRPGMALPSENQLAAEFGVARATVLKSLQSLKQDGWIESQQGKANFVRGQPTARRTAPAHTRAALEADESTAVELLSVTPVLAEPRVAALLNIAEGTPVYRLSRRTVSDDGPIDLVTIYIPVDVAAGSDVGKPEPIAGSLLAHLASRKDIRGDYAVEWTTARRPTPEEAELLDIGKDDPVLAVMIAAYTAAGDPVLASLLVLPGSRHEIEDTYPLA